MTSRRCEFATATQTRPAILKTVCAEVDVNNRIGIDPLAGRFSRAFAYVLAWAAVACAQTAAYAPSDPVLVIRGLSDDAQRADACTPSFRREQFDGLIRVVPRAGLVSKARLTQTYAEMLPFANAAREAGIDQTTEYPDNKI